MTTLFDELARFRDSELAVRRTPSSTKKKHSAPSAQTTMALLDPPATTVPPEGLWVPHHHLRREVWEPGFPERYRTPRCTPTVLVRRGTPDDVTSSYEYDTEYAYRGHAKHSAYRPGCLGCGWLGGVTNDERLAAEAAHDHSHPGWRDMPRVRDLEGNTGYEIRTKAERWQAVVAHLYPEGWFEAGGPVLTLRRSQDPHPDRIPGGGYDLWGGNVVATKGPKPPKSRLFPVEDDRRHGYYDYRRQDDEFVLDPETNTVVKASVLREREYERRRKEAEAKRAAERAEWEAKQAALRAQGETASAPPPMDDLDEDACPYCGEVEDCFCEEDEG